MAIYRWQQSTYEVKLKQKQLEMTRIYNDSFKSLIDVVRKNQHDFIIICLLLQLWKMKKTWKDKTAERMNIRTEFLKKISIIVFYIELMNLLSQDFIWQIKRNWKYGCRNNVWCKFMHWENLNTYQFNVHRNSWNINR